MNKPKIHRGECLEGAPLVIMARILGASATAITQATCTALSYIVDQYASEDDAVEDSNASSIQTETTAGSVSSLIYDTLQTNNDWEADSTGYNFKMTLPPASFPAGNKWYRVEVWVDPASGDDFPGFIGVFYCHSTAKD